MTDNLELKGTVCPICGYEFKFGTPDEIEFHRVICVPSNDWEEMMMTNREAIEWIKDMREQNWYIYNCERYHIEALSLAIEALEKRIPKKLIKYDIDYSGNPLFRCPVCGDSWNSNEFGDGIEYCWTCGQALDWSNADDN